jgi:PadR family transcriptional regulator PadR
MSVAGEAKCPATKSHRAPSTSSSSKPSPSAEIAESIEQQSEDILQVEEGSLYPALQRMLIKGWVVAEWGVTAGNRRARYYTLTADGRKQLAVELGKFQRIMGAVTRVIQTA